MTMTDRLAGINEGVAVKAPCKVATTANLTSLSGLLTVDGVTLTAGDRVLVKDQSTGSQNGIYVAAAGAWERAQDFDGTRDVVEGTTVFVISGSTNGSSFFRLSTTDPDVGTDSLSFTQLFDAASWNFTQSGTGAVTRSAQSKMRDIVNVFDFMTASEIAAVRACSLAYDNTEAIQAAIDSLPAAGGTVYFPSGWYKVTESLVCGDGDGSTTASTTNGIKLVGCGAGFGVSGTLVPTVLNWSGANDGSFMVQFQGRMSDCAMEGIFLACGGYSSGVYLRSMTGFNMRNVKIVNPKGFGIYSLGGGTPVGNYNIFNIYDNISIALLTASSVGLELDGSGYGTFNNDNWFSQFRNMRIETVSGATNAVCMWLKFSDSCSFYRCHFDSQPEATSIGVVFDSLANDEFPCGHAFYDCSIYDHAVYEDGSHNIRKNYFYGFGTYDSETVPTNAGLVGITDTGVVFNNFLSGIEPSAAFAATAWTSASATIAATSGSITTKTGTVRSYTAGKFCFFHLTVVITTNGTGSGAVTAALPQNAKSKATFSGWNETDDVPVFGYMTAAANTLTLKKADGSYPGADGKTIVIGGVYEVA